MTDPRSPYAAALGERIELLHPRLRQYFSTIAPGHVGIGDGVFWRVGTRLRWLRPLMRPLERRGVLFSGWEEHVPFRITNRTLGGRAVSERVFEFARGPWVMRDAVSLTPQGRLVDVIGRPAFVVARFDVEVRAGMLALTSRAVGIRAGRMRLRLPRFASPTVRLSERFDEHLGRHVVEVTIDAPVLGRIYEYAGEFDYRIEKEA